MWTDDEQQLKHLLDEVAMLLRDTPLESVPPEVARRIYQRMRDITGRADPYQELKQRSTEKALSLYPKLKKHVDRSSSRLLTAMRIAIAGNVIDFGANASFDMEKAIHDVLEKDFAICDYEEFIRCLKDADEVLYIGDNAGETVFDRILIEELERPVTFAVRGKPIINDVTSDDAIQAGLDKVATIISSGTDAPGTILQTCNSTFAKKFQSARCIISKGQGNYEALSDQVGPIFFLLLVKCRVIAKHLGVSVGDIVMKGSHI
jgi:hypothetical protein